MAHNETPGRQGFHHLPPAENRPPIPACVITVSDRCAAGQAEDISGPLACELLSAYGVEVRSLRVVPDGVESVYASIAQGLEAGMRLIMTTGGTGVSPRDWTPDATEPLLAVHLDGLADAIRRRGEAHAPTACLSRGLAGISGREPGAAVIVNAPGSPGGVRDTVAVVGPLIAHLLDQIDGGDHPRSDS